jgi:hypothetical protein
MVWQQWVSGSHHFKGTYCLHSCDFPRGDAVANIRLSSGHDYLVTHSYMSTFFNSGCLSCAKQVNSIMDQDHVPDRAVLNSGGGGSSSRRRYGMRNSLALKKLFVLASFLCN